MSMHTVSRVSLLVSLLASWAEARPLESRDRCNTTASAFFVEAPLRLPSAVSNEGSGTSTTGINLVDVDNDGDLDVFVAQGTASLDARPNELFINNGRGWFRDESASRLPRGHDSNSTKADFADVDGDGNLDAIVANVGPEQLLVNDGTGHFSDGAGRLPEAPDLLLDISSNAHFADVDQDGCPDILIANENPFDSSPLHGAQNRLLMNDCSGRFRDETAERLLPVTDQSAALLTGDIDMDGDLDIVVLNRGPELVYLNDGSGYFQDETAARFPV
ncbi:MAG TPA: VCBS repeat-containing protein, partial [Polyangiaceae bacterium]